MMGRVRPAVYTTTDPTLLKILKSVSEELGIPKARLTDEMSASGFVEILKAADAAIPFAADVERSVNGPSAANLEQEKRTRDTSQNWLPVDRFVDDKYGDFGMYGVKAKPTYAQEEVTVNSKFPAESLYKKSSPYMAAARAVRKGTITKGDIRSVLKLGGAYDAEIEEVMKSFDKTLSALDEIDKTIEVVKGKQDDWAHGWNETLKRHRKVLGYRGEDGYEERYVKGE
jgi:hypothetical protein